MRRGARNYNGQLSLPGVGKLGAKLARYRRGKGNPETALAKAVADWCFLHPGVVGGIARTNAGLARSLDGRQVMRLAPAGWPDLTGYMADGRFLAIECKLPGEPLRSEQAERLADVARCGGVAIVATDVEKFGAEVKAALRKA